MMPVGDPGKFSPGTQMNRMMDAMGFPDIMGDLYGASLDKAVGNQAGVARNLFDAFSPLSTNQLDKFTSGFAPPAFLPRPFQDFGRLFGQQQKTFYDKESIGVVKEDGIRGALGHQDVQIDGKKIDVGKQDKGLTPQKLESKILTDPAFRQKIEQQLGGRIVLDGNPDGNITIAKKQPHFPGPYQNNVHQNIGNFLQKALGPPMGVMNGVLNQMAGFLKGIGAGMAGQQAGQAGQAQQAGQAGQTGGASGAGGKDELQDILNSNMSFEAKLNAFMMKFMEKKQKEVEGKMQKMKDAQSKEGGAEGAGGPGGAAGGGGKKGGGGGGKKGGGGGKKGGGGGKKGLGSLLQMGGGVLGGMYGGPIGASMGSQIGGAAGQMVGGAGGGGGAQGAQQGGEAGKGKGSEQLAMKELENAMQEFQRMMESMGNVMKSVQDMIMKSAGNIRS